MDDAFNVGDADGGPSPDFSVVDAFVPRPPPVFGATEILYCVKYARGIYK